MKCTKCNDTGLVPFVKNGKVIPHTYIHCGCYEEPIEYFHPMTPEDIDYPCSYAWRSYYEEQITGKPLPSLYPEPEPEPEKQDEVVVKHQVIYEHRHTDSTEQDHKRLDRIERELAAIKGRRAQVRANSPKESEAEDNGRIDITNSFGSRS